MKKMPLFASALLLVLYISGCKEDKSIQENLSKKHTDTICCLEYPVNFAKQGYAVNESPETTAMRDSMWKALDSAAMAEKQ